MTAIYKSIEEYLGAEGKRKAPGGPQAGRQPKRCARIAGVNGKRCSPYTFRHTFARKYLPNGGDPFSPQQIPGQRSLQTVRLYVNLWGTDIQAQHRKYSPAESLLGR